MLSGDLEVNLGDERGILKPFRFGDIIVTREPVNTKAMRATMECLGSVKFSNVEP